ncbi:hypothetical protein Vadar_034418 [Vaccinium darrowii]|uniref:Uncharacterized protein n=1 Tax=Vaccinium darrowii TaxID=229202 RepID=A0ACB7Y4D5_9ERIC|nr:hypothetical protein Vadar_034418 [Vaccinium darrowii]
MHRTFHKLSLTLGPVFSLRFGSQLVVVICSPSAAEECFTKNDIVLANRPRFIAGKYIGYDYTNVVNSPYGDHWRNLRRLMSQEIFSTGRLNVFLSIRHEEVGHLLHQLYKKSSTDFAKVEMQSKLSGLTLNNIIRMIAGKRYYGDDVEESAEAEEFRAIVSDVFSHGGASNLADFLPILRWIDYKSFEKNLEKTQNRLDALLQGLIDEHRRDTSKNTMIDHLLKLQESQPEYYTDAIIKGLMSRMLKKFLGRVSYLRRFIPALAEISAPFGDLLKGRARFEWRAEHQCAFERIKAVLASLQTMIAPQKG